jgi:hypothetical protein
MRSRTVYRLLFAVLVVASLLALAAGYLASTGQGTSAEIATQATLDPDEQAAVVPPREGITVVTTDSNVLADDRGYGPRSKAELVAFDRDGTVLYYDDSHFVYWDVDPSPEGETTVTYTASDHLSEEECNARSKCTRNVIERANLTTGEVERLYSRITPGKHATRWHDVDRIDEEHYVVADIARDRVFVVNVTSDLVVWEWDVLSEFDPESGGPYPGDWTHVNDVEVLDDGRIMVSLRNQDQVVFLDRETGMDRDWTLGSEDDYDTLYEQHNPDFIPEEWGGPAVVVADSENNRVVEYQRVGDGWERTWEWSDTDLQWPRDADRLPDGHTLVTDSNGNRVLEVDREGEVVWAVEIAFPYEAERLGAGDESAGGESTRGESARELGLASRTAESGGGKEELAHAGPVARLTGTVKRTVPGRLLNGVMYVTPVWMDVGELLALLVGTVGGLAWAGAELRWSSMTLDLRSPLLVRRK